MVSLAVATLLLGGMPSFAARQQPNYVLPLYDLCTSVTNLGISGNSVQGDFMVSGPLTAFENFRVFTYNGDTSHFQPTGNWNEVTNSCSWAATGAHVTVTFNISSNTRGTLWVQYAGGPGDSQNGAETNFVAAGFNMPQSPGHGSRPGALVPIVDVVPTSDPQQIPSMSMVFDLYQPYGGSWGTGGGPAYWQSTGSNAVGAPGGGWQTLTNANTSQSNGGRQVTGTATPNAFSGFYAIGVLESYTPSESYNTHNSVWTEFSGVIRAFSLG
jgi:hypothetical protein